MRFRLPLTAALVLAVMLVAVYVIPAQPPVIQAAVPTTVPDTSGTTSDTVSRSRGGIYHDGIAIEGSRNQVEWTVKGSDGQTADLARYENYAGTKMLGLGIDGALAIPANVANMGLPSVIHTAMGTVTTAGVTTDIAVVPAGETWLIHSVLINVTTDYACTGDDCTLIVGDAGDTDGFLVLADAAMQAADTEGTGWAAGWQGMAAAEIGAYLDDNNNAFVEVATTDPVTITATAGEASGTTMSTGAAMVYVVYTRID